jgi:hypothetical protein
MFLAIFKWTLISLSLIFLIHYLYTFLMNTLTVPKLKDLVNKPAEQYKDMFSTITNAANTNLKYKEREMEDELSSFLNDLKMPPNGKALPIGKVGNDYSSALYDKNSIIPNANDGIGINISNSISNSNSNNTIDHSLEPNLDNLVASNENDFNYASLLAGGSLMT